MSSGLQGSCGINLRHGLVITGGGSDTSTFVADATYLGRTDEVAVLVNLLFFTDAAFVNRYFFGLVWCFRAWPGLRQPQLQIFE
jgi:hypothetical protein